MATQMVARRTSLAAALVLLASLVGVPAAGADRGVEPGAARVEMVDLGSPLVTSEFLGGSAVHINDRGVVIANLEGPAGVGGAFRWEDGVRTRLLGLDGPDSPAMAVHINTRGQVVGWSRPRSENADHAVLWEPDGTVMDLGVPGQLSAAMRINRRGTVLGVAQVGFDTRTVIWRDGEMTVLDPLPCCDNQPIGINDVDQVVVLTSDRAAFLWDDGTVTPLTLPGSLEVVPQDINRRGQVIGSPADPVRASSVGVVWDESGERTVFGTLGGPFISPHAINRRGEVVGSSATGRVVVDEGGPREQRHAFLWRDGTLLDLGTLIGSEGFSDAVAVNDRGQIVGSSSTTSEVRPVAWDDEEIIDLGSLGGRAGLALDINRRGQIVGQSQDAEGVWHLVMWTIN